MGLQFSERELRRLGDRDLARIVSGVHDVFKSRHPDLGDIALAAKARVKTSKDAKPASPESLEAVVAGHVDKFIQLGLNEELDQTEEEYRRAFTIPEGGIAQPESYKGQFDVLSVIDPRVILPRVHKRACITEYIDAGKITNLTLVPKRPYIAWTHDANRYRPYTVDQAIAMFADGEVGSPQIEVTALYLNHPEFFRDRGVDAAGSRCGRGRVPCLSAFSGEPEVGAGSLGFLGQDWGALSRGKEIIELGS